MTKGEIQLMIDTAQKELNYYIKHRDELQKQAQYVYGLSAKLYDLRIKATQDKIQKFNDKLKTFEATE